MRDWLVILLVVAGAIFGMRQCGCFSTSDTPAGAGEAMGEPADGGAGEAAGGQGESRVVELLRPLRVDRVTGEEAGSAAGEERRTAGGGAAAEVPAERLGQIREVVAEWLASTGQPGDIQRIREVLTGMTGDPAAGPLVRAALDALAEDPGVAWGGASRLAESAALRLAPAERGRLLARVEALARNALRDPGRSWRYEVAPGDSLARIAGKLERERSLRTSVGLIQWLNGISGTVIHPKQVLWAPLEDVTLVASKRLFLLRLYVGDGLVREYPIGLGRDDKTPAGTFVLKRPLEKAPWRNPETGEIIFFDDPRYAIGTRWIGFEEQGPHRGLGIHGTNEPDSVGRSESLGCIRMRNADVEALAEFVSAGMTITIHDS